MNTESDGLRKVNPLGHAHLAAFRKYGCNDLFKINPESLQSLARMFLLNLDLTMLHGNYFASSSFSTEISRDLY